MSIWILHQKLTPEEEQKILTTSGVLLPFDQLPDLSLVTSQWQCRDLLQKLHPEKPPEAIMLQLDRIWKQFTGVSQDDTIAVPLPASKQVALARVSGRYRYEVGADGADRHIIPVEWYPKMASMASFGKFKDLFDYRQQDMVEVGEKEARIRILDKLPYKYNRFAKWKWIVMVFFLLNALSFILRMLHE